MSTQRFKSKNNYFEKRSSLTERVIQTKPKKTKSTILSTTVPVSLLYDRFCTTAQSFEIEGEGRFSVTECALDESLQRHLNSDKTVLVNPLDKNGMTSWHLVRFTISDNLDQPFSKAREYSDALAENGISSLLEVTEEGKGNYNLWIFHDSPVLADNFSESLRSFGKSTIEHTPRVMPDTKDNSFVPLPLQYESMLLQRRVFVNTVGKKIKDQREVLENIETTDEKTRNGFLSQYLSTTDDIPKPANEERGTGLTPETQDDKQKILEVNKPKNIKIDKIETEPSERFAINIFKITDKYYGIPAKAVKEFLPYISSKDSVMPAEIFIPEHGTIRTIAPEKLIGNTGDTQYQLSKLIVFENSKGLFAIPVKELTEVKVMDVVLSGSKQEQRLGTTHYENDTIDIFDPELISLDILKTGPMPKPDVNPEETLSSESYAFWTNNDEHYALKSSDIIEIISDEKMKRIPGSDGESIRVVGYRGSYIKIIDIDSLKKDGNTSITPLRQGHARILVTAHDESYVGILISKIDVFANVDKNQISGLPDSFDSWCSGLVAYNGESSYMIINPRNI